MELSSEGRPCLAEMDGWRAGEGFVKSAILVLLLGFLGASTTLRPLKEMAFATSGSWDNQIYFLLHHFFFKCKIFLFLCCFFYVFADFLLYFVLTDKK